MTPTGETVHEALGELAPVLLEGGKPLKQLTPVQLLAFACLELAHSVQQQAEAIESISQELGAASIGLGEITSVLEDVKDTVRDNS